MLMFQTSGHWEFLREKVEAEERASVKENLHTSESKAEKKLRTSYRDRIGG